MQSEIDTQTQQAQQLTVSQAELESTREELQSHLDANTELISKLEDDVVTYDKQIGEKEQRIQGLTQAKRDTDSEIQKLKNEIEEQKEKYQCLADVQALMKSAK